MNKNRIEMTVQEATVEIVNILNKLEYECNIKITDISLSSIDVSTIDNVGLALKKVNIEYEV